MLKNTFDRIVGAVGERQRNRNCALQEQFGYAKLSAETLEFLAKFETAPLPRKVNPSVDLCAG